MVELRASRIHSPIGRATLEADNSAVFGDAGLCAIAKFTTEESVVLVHVA